MERPTRIYFVLFFYHLNLYIFFVVLYNNHRHQHQHQHNRSIIMDDSPGYMSSNLYWQINIGCVVIITVNLSDKEHLHYMYNISKIGNSYVRKYTINITPKECVLMFMPSVTCFWSKLECRFCFLVFIIFFFFFGWLFPQPTRVYIYTYCLFIWIEIYIVYILHTF